MGRRSRTRSLGLWMNGSFVGTWRNEPHVGEVLQYDANWVTSKQGRSLSLSLPFTPGNEPHRHDAVRTYFENLLPDSKIIRERVARRFQTNKFAGNICTGRTRQKDIFCSASPVLDAVRNRWTCKEFQPIHTTWRYL